MIEVWIKTGKSMIMCREQNSEWYLRWHETYGCWTVGGWNRYRLLSEGWEQLS